MASVTRIEALGYPGITPEEENAILEFIHSSPVYALDDEVIEQADPSAPTKENEIRGCDHRRHRRGVWNSSGHPERGRLQTHRRA
jgi:hypothetical protein